MYGRQKIIRIEQIHIQIVLLVRDDEKVNYELTKRSMLHFLDQKVNLLFKGKKKKDTQITWKKLPWLKF